MAPKELDPEEISHILLTAEEAIRSAGRECGGVIGEAIFELISYLGLGICDAGNWEAREDGTVWHWAKSDPAAQPLAEMLEDRDFVELARLAGIFQRDIGMTTGGAGAMSDNVADSLGVIMNRLKSQ